MSGRAVHEATRVDFYASHEGLHLLYEQAQTRFIARQKRWYNLSTHMPWIGMRTAQLDGAHVEYFRGIANPIGVKVGAAMSARVAAGAGHDAQPAEPAGAADPHPPLRRQGHRRSGCRRVIEAVRATGQPVLWVCDPMHGNTETTHRAAEDPPLREHPQGARAGVPHPRGAGLAPRRRAHRADRRGCHRMHRRRARSDRRGPAARLPLAGRSAPEPRAGAGAGHADRAPLRRPSCAVKPGSGKPLTSGGDG